MRETKFLFSGKQSFTHEHRRNEKREKSDVAKHRIAVVDLSLVTDNGSNVSVFYIPPIPPFYMVSLGSVCTPYTLQWEKNNDLK